MKKIVLALLIVFLFCNVSFAQEIKPNRLFTADNTIWSIVGMNAWVGFSGGTVYSCMNETTCFPLTGLSSYSNIFLFTVFELGIAPNVTSGSLIPIIGIGTAQECTSSVCESFPMRKIGNWDPTY